MIPTIPKGLRFTFLHKAFRQQLDIAVKDFDLTGVQFAVLSQLNRLEFSGMHEISQKTLEEATHTTHPTMTEILKKLEKKSFIVCSTSQTDRRIKLISSTEKSRALHLHLQECDEDIFTSLCANIPQEDINTMLRVTEQMLNNAKALITCPCAESKGADTL